MCLLSPPENVIWGEFEDCFSAWSLPWSSDNTSPNAQITSTARVQWFLHIWTHHPFQFCAIQMPAAMHCGHCFNTSTAWLCLSHQAEKRWKLEKCPLFVKQCSSAKKKSPAWWAQCIQNTLICTYSAYEQEICHGRATELCVLVMHWSTGGLMTPGFVRFILVCIHASKC